jgi:hypothetical protein
MNQDWGGKVRYYIGKFNGRENQIRVSGHDGISEYIDVTINSEVGNWNVYFQLEESGLCTLLEIEHENFQSEPVMNRSQQVIDLKETKTIIIKGDWVLSHFSTILYSIKLYEGGVVLPTSFIPSATRQLVIYEITNHSMAKKISFLMKE